MTAEAVPALLKKPFPLSPEPEAQEDEVASESSDSSWNSATADAPADSSWDSFAEDALFTSPAEPAGEEVAPEVVAEAEAAHSSDSSGTERSGPPDDSEDLFTMGAPGVNSNSGNGGTGGNVPLFFIVCGAIITFFGLITLALKHRHPPSRY
jgi:hypothetical protein